MSDMSSCSNKAVTENGRNWRGLFLCDRVPAPHLCVSICSWTAQSCSALSWASAACSSSLLCSTCSCNCALMSRSCTLCALMFACSVLSCWILDSSLGTGSKSYSLNYRNMTQHYLDTYLFLFAQGVLQILLPNLQHLLELPSLFLSYVFLNFYNELFKYCKDDTWKIKGICTWVERFSRSSRIWLSVSSYMDRTILSCSLSRLEQKTQMNEHTGRIQLCHQVNAEVSREEDGTFAGPVPDCPSLGCSPVTGTPHGSGWLPEHWAALVCLSGARSTKNWRPADWKHTQTHKLLSFKMSSCQWITVISWIISLQKEILWQKTWNMIWHIVQTQSSRAAIQPGFQSHQAETGWALVTWTENSRAGPAYP